LIFVEAAGGPSFRREQAGGIIIRRGVVVLGVGRCRGSISGGWGLGLSELARPALIACGAG
jgi:hypothetical protein